ncbi:carbohydrate kinase family protein [Streptomyces meridianus]|uniref:Carbohydrate kinase family protein n=1 Tax=Streptomyces meridianus TaxID=2938945 RepID=A0ABT0XE46_9ACTN|nr:carbohydrate kinase family protein [Streptomyces meridianus]MCM2580605.1 carbohydrate kinase family protein [Streptomyces meridianus]
MHIALTGSIATDHLMTFPGRFADQLLPDQLDRVSLSFLADGLEVRRGGVAANIAFGMAQLGLRPILVGAAGTDFTDYSARLQADGVNTKHVQLSNTQHTARFVCTTDLEQNQIATFYPGAMSEARDIDLTRVAKAVGNIGLVVVAPNDPQAMLLHTEACQRLGIAIAADPSQQMARLEGKEIRLLVQDARYLFTNEYEAALLQEKTGWTESQVLQQIGTWVSTLGDSGVKILREGSAALHVPAVPTTAALDPTGVGDAFRAGFLAAASWHLNLKNAARIGCALATTVLESIGTQEYKVVPSELVSRLSDTYGSDAALAMEPHLLGVS